MSRRIIIFYLCFSCLHTIFSQNPDSLILLGEDVIESKVEHLENASEAGIDLDELTSDLSFFLEHPMNINSADKTTFGKLGFLTDIQIKNLLDYRKKYGEFYSIYELTSIDGFGKNTIEKMMPFTVVGPVVEGYSNMKYLFRGRHELIMRYQRKLVWPAGYILPNDSLQESKAGSMYLGDPNRYYLRYRYRVKNKLSIGFLAEKDPGEIFIHANRGVISSIQSQITKKPGFDFHSLHLSIEKLKFFRQIILGDFHVRFGQGLVLWSGLGFMGGSDPTSVKRYAPGINPNTSANEGTFMRGAAVHMNWKVIDLTVFYSQKRRDANIEINENGILSASSLPSGGYHRTLNEIDKKNRLQEQHFGGHISYTASSFRIGLSACKTLLDIPYLPSDEPYRKFQFRGSENFNAGINFDILLKRTNLFGEVGISPNGGWAALAGITHNTPNGSIFALMVREYRQNYQNMLAQAAGRHDGNTNERGIRVSMEIPMFRKFVMLINWEHYTYPWITSRTNNIFRGQDYNVKLDYQVARKTLLSVRYRYRAANVKDNSNLTWFDEMLDEYKHEFRFEARFAISSSFSFKTQAQYVIQKATNSDEGSKGSLLLQDVYFHPERWPCRFTFRYAVFNTDDYNSRLYAYEHDVLYASSMPAYYGKGYRLYLVMKYSPAKWLDSWLRFSLTTYTDRNIIGSGAEEIVGNKVPEIKLQIRIKL